MAAETLELSLCARHVAVDRRALMRHQIAIGANRITCPIKARKRALELSGARTLPTDKRLLQQAMRLDLTPAPNTAVLWSGRANRELAKRFCDAHPGGGYVTLETILERHYGTFYRELCHLAWETSEEIWYLLSAKLAEAASGAVRVFAAGIVNPEDDPSGSVAISSHKSVHRPREGARAAYCNSVFEKVEGPALDNNPRADPVFFMGRNINAKPSRY